jgi:phosphohistidine phosphatase
LKTVIIVRHAKSSWDDAALSDFERPLNERGKQDAPEMAGRLIKRNVSIDTFISSPARRARKTAAIFAKAYGLHKEDLVLKDELYHAPEKVFYEVISQLPETTKSPALFAHNPGLTDFVNMLTNTRIDNVPTCGIFAVSFSAPWSEFRSAPKELLFFDYPRNQFD